jgi:hypothetical protein
VNRLSTAFAVLALISGCVAVAQTPPQNPIASPSGVPSNVDPSATVPVPSTEPSTSDQSTSQPAQSGDTSGGSRKADKKTMMKDCVAQQRANNTQMSKHDAKKACKDQVNSSPQG